MLIRKAFSVRFALEINNVVFLATPHFMCNKPRLPFAFAGRLCSGQIKLFASKTNLPKFASTLRILKDPSTVVLQRLLGDTLVEEEAY